MHPKPFDIYNILIQLELQVHLAVVGLGVVVVGVVLVAKTFV